VPDVRRVLAGSHKVLRGSPKLSWRTWPVQSCLVTFVVGLEYQLISRINFSPWSAAQVRDKYLRKVGLERWLGKLGDWTPYLTGWRDSLFVEDPKWKRQDKYNKPLNLFALCASCSAHSPSFPFYASLRLAWFGNAMYIAPACALYWLQHTQRIYCPCLVRAEVARLRKFPFFFIPLHRNSRRWVSA
jgi:hypothetical protein